MESLAGGLLKLAGDLRLMASGPSTGFREIRLPAVQEGSSFFSGKINPVIPETVMQCAFLVQGSAATARAALQHGELNLNVFEGVAGIAVLESLQWLTLSLKQFNENCFSGITAFSDENRRK
jgi:aspartate ammonia-lyase